MIYFVFVVWLRPYCETLTYPGVVVGPVRLSSQHALIGAGGAAGNTGREFHAANAANAGDLHLQHCAGDRGGHRSRVSLTRSLLNSTARFGWI